MSDSPDPDPVHKRHYGTDVKSGHDPKGERVDANVENEEHRERAKDKAPSPERQKAKFAEQARTSNAGGTVGPKGVVPGPQPDAP